jgi:hypothetical protein
MQKKAFSQKWKKDLHNFIDKRQHSERENKKFFFGTKFLLRSGKKQKLFKIFLALPLFSD